MAESERVQESMSRTAESEFRVKESMESRTAEPEFRVQDAIWRSEHLGRSAWSELKRRASRRR